VKVAGHRRQVRRRSGWYVVDSVGRPSVLTHIRENACLRRESLEQRYNMDEQETMMSSVSQTRTKSDNESYISTHRSYSPQSSWREHSLFDYA